MTAVIEASSAGVKDMADGSLRITFEFEPRHAAEAFALFGPRGRAVAVAALKDGAAAIPPNSTELEKPKGGEVAKLAGMWCNDPDFWLWAEVSNAAQATEVMRAYAGIKSRAELDHDPVALETFNRNIRFPFQKFMIARGIRKAAP